MQPHGGDTWVVADEYSTPSDVACRGHELNRIGFVSVLYRFPIPHAALRMVYYSHMGRPTQDHGSRSARASGDGIDLSVTKPDRWSPD